MQVQINSVYFTHINYDEGNESLQVNYSTGQIKTFDDVTEQEFNELLKSNDLNNNLWMLIRKKLEEQRIEWVQVQTGFAEHPRKIHDSEIEFEIHKIDEQLNEVEKNIKE